MIVQPIRLKSYDDFLYESKKISESSIEDYKFHVGRVSLSLVGQKPTGVEYNINTNFKGSCLGLVKSTNGVDSFEYEFKPSDLTNVNVFIKKLESLVPGNYTGNSSSLWVRNMKQLWNDIPHERLKESKGFFEILIEDVDFFEYEEILFLKDCKRINENFYNLLDSGILYGINEGWIDKIKKVADGASKAIVKIKGKAVEVKDNIFDKIAKVADKGAQVLNAVVTTIGNVGDELGNAISELVKKAVSMIVSDKKKDIEKAVEKEAGSEEAKESLRKEVKSGKETVKFFFEKFSKDLKGITGAKGEKGSDEGVSLKDKVKNMIGESFDFKNNVFELMKEELLIEKRFDYVFEKMISTLNEEEHGDHGHGDHHDEHGHGGGVIHKLVHGLSNYPPFSWLGKAAHFIGSNVARGLSALSKFVAEELGGPGAYEFPKISKIIGYLGEIQFKNVVKSLVIAPIIKFVFPPVGILITVISNIALFVATWEIIETLIK